MEDEILRTYIHRVTKQPVELVYRDDVCAQYRKDPTSLVLTDSTFNFDDDYEPAAEDELQLVISEVKDMSQARRIMTQMSARIDELENEANDDEAIRERMAELLTGVANGLKGKPPVSTLHDWSGLPELARQLRERLAAIEKHSSSFGLFCSMTQAEAELAGQPIADSVTALYFMGSGASHRVSWGDIRAMLNAIYPQAADAVRCNEAT